jgi:hypothetical protein
MIKFPCKCVWLCAVFLGVTAIFGSNAMAQDGGAASAARSAGAKPENLNLDLQLQLLVASDTGSDPGTLPASLSALAREIRNNLHVTQVRLGATMEHRVEVNGRLEVAGVATAFLASPTSNTQFTPTFYSYSLGAVKLGDAGTAEETVQLIQFRFSLQVPVQTGQSKAEGQPSINYQNVGVTTNATIRIGEPTLIGTLNIGRPDETLVLVLTARRVGVR